MRVIDKNEKAPVNMITLNGKESEDDLIRMLNTLLSPTEDPVHKKKRNWNRISASVWKGMQERRWI